MLKALVIKELRESAGIIAVALLAAVYVLTNITGAFWLPQLYRFESNGLPFLSDGFSFAFVLIIGALAIALGLKQSAVEGIRGTYFFLLHRPATRKFIFGTKMAVGIAVVLTLGGLLVLVYALWVATPGNTATPFSWSMTVPAWQLWLCLSLVYLGAFFSGIRPARWFGTRLVPLVAAAVCAFVISWFLWTWLVLVSVALCAALMTASIFYYAQQRDY